MIYQDWNIYRVGGKNVFLLGGGEKKQKREARDGDRVFIVRADENGWIAWVWFEKEKRREDLT